MSSVNQTVLSPSCSRAKVVSKTAFPIKEKKKKNSKHGILFSNKLMHPEIGINTQCSDKKVLREHFYYINWDTSVRCCCPGAVRRWWVFYFYQFYYSAPFCHWFSFVSALLTFGFPLKSGWKYLKLWGFCCFLSYCLCPDTQGQKRAISSGSPRELRAWLSRSSQALSIMLMRHTCKSQSAQKTGCWLSKKVQNSTV